MNRGYWATRIGFVLAASGSAVGLGNVWKFPYITGVNGGGAFVFVYLLCILAVGLPIMIAEMTIGKLSQRNPVGAFREIEHQGTPWQAIGWMGVVCAFIILSYYSVVAGWTVGFLVRSLLGVISQGSEMALVQNLFAELVGNPAEQVFWHAVFMALTVAIVSGGVRSGLERWADILMPTLMVLLLGLWVYAMTLPTAGEALTFLFAPDFGKLTPDGVLEAMGHAFFTLSLGMGAIITYGSYLAPQANVARAGGWVVFLDTAIALVAGMAIYPFVFMFNLEPGAGPGLIFTTLPIAFAQSAGGQFIAIVFFLLLAFAALTSTISLLEVAVSFFCDELGWDRRWAALGIGGAIFALGVPSALHGGFFDTMDGLATNVLLPLGGLGIALYAGWVLDRAKLDHGLGEGVSAQFVTVWLGMIKYVTPLLVLAVFLHKLRII